MARVLLTNLNKKYDEKTHAVKDVNLEIRDREFVVLVGPSGCGKTTTLRMVAGLEEITSGEIRIDERVVNDLPPMDRDIAMVFQAADILGIHELLARRPRQLSGGQRQRVALGRAIVRHPRVFLFDEPLSNLDAKLRVQMRVELKRLHERLSTTAIYVTHDQVEAMTLGDRVVVMKDGVVQQVGEPMQLYAHPANRFVASFIGSPAMNFLAVTLVQAYGGLWAEAPGLRVKVPPTKQESLGRHAGGRVVLGVRPEALRIANGSDGPDYAIESTIEVVEPLGSEILLDVRAGEHPIVARVDPGTRVKVHDTVRLALDPERLHFFDFASEAAL
jgi:multiple sugar transport system ATP-binding protein